MARFNCSLICAPQPIAKILRLFPKLALLFLIVHVGVMIYSIVNSTAPVKKSLKTEQLHTRLEQIKGERILSHGVNDSLTSINHNKSGPGQNGMIKGTLLEKLFNREHMDVN